MNQLLQCTGTPRRTETLIMIHNRVTLATTARETARDTPRSWLLDPAVGRTTTPLRPCERTEQCQPQPRQAAHATASCGIGKRRHRRGREQLSCQMTLTIANSSVQKQKKIDATRVAGGRQNLSLQPCQPSAFARCRKEHRRRLDVKGVLLIMCPCS